MKIIKMLITMSILNAIVVVAMVVMTPKTQTPEIISGQTQGSAPTMTPVATTATVAPTSTQKSTVRPAVSVVPATAPTAKPTVTPTVAPTQAPTPKPAGCVIQIDGVKYEITSLIRSHSGGNVFTCNTDMSAIFWGRHNQKILQMMQKYRI